MADKKKSASRSAARSQNRNQVADLKTSSGEKEASKDVKAAARDQDGRKAPEKKQESKIVRRDNKGSSAAKGPSKWQIRLRSNRFVRFILDAYYELRHKVTWPTFHEARNMTIVVLLLSTAIGLLLGVVDYGLQSLYVLLVHLGGK
jgi:preprotein translocase SecE subunit